MAELQYIPLSELHHHPKNPRLDLGDLTELTESIKSRGVMQNLTVVPRKRGGGYYVVIGNRRMEASKMAGLDQLPCVVVQMTEKEQMSTMLLENMQRSDLTVYEQACGFQMMMDLGMTTEEISTATGFSDTTVRRRVKLCQYNKVQFKSACERGATLMDFLELSKVEDEEDRARLLARCQHEGAAQFRSGIHSALDNQHRRKVVDTLTPRLKAFARKLPEQDRYSSKYEEKHRWQIKDALTTFKEPADCDKVKYFYYITNWEITLSVQRKKPPMSASERQRIEAEKRRKEHSLEVQGFVASAYEMRKRFVSTFSPRADKLQKLRACIVSEALGQEGYLPGTLRSYHDWSEEVFRELVNMPKDNTEEKNNPSLLQECWNKQIPEGRALLAWMLCGGIHKDGKTVGCINTYDGSYKHNQDLDAIYTLLKNVGYEMTDFEKQMLHGTHECFQQMNRKENEQ
ncbi:MAG: ParB/RepB/Spo0J family partition protein [Clostridia bacterium]|nr:ParB/RepB/Spo0J family partition protein [Clostridia bacterium]